MKVLTIITYYRPHWTGLTRHAVGVAESLAGRGHDVTVLTTRHSRGLAADEMLDGVRVIRLRPFVRFSRAMLAPSFALEAPRRIAETDAVHMHTPLPESLYVAAVCRAKAKPLVMTHHGDVVLPPGLRNQMLQRLAGVLSRASARRATFVTSYSDDYTRHSKVLSPASDHTVAIDPPVSLPPPEPERVSAWRAELGLTGRALVGAAGRFVHEKGLDILLEAMPRVRETLPDAHLIFAGERNVVYENELGRCRDLLEAQQGHVTFVDLLRDRQAMANFYAMCDVLALPSRTEMFAMSQVEALLSGTPVVASDIPGARVVVQRTGFGRLTAPNDAEALRSALVDVLQHPSRFQPSREIVRTEFDTDATFRAYDDLLEAALRKTRRSRSRRRRRVDASKRDVRPDPSPTPSELRDGRNGSSRARAWRCLSEADHQTLDGLLGNEADMAFRRRARILMDYLELRDGQRVLDSGCGFGFHSMAIGRLRSVHVVGLDRTRARLNAARTKRVDASFVNGTVGRLPFASESFDAVLLSEVLEHVDDEHATLVEAFRVLKPGGTLAVSVPHARYPLLWDPINRVWTAVGGAPIRRGPIAGIWSGHVRLYEPARLTEALEAAGFVVETVEEATHFAFPFVHFLVYGIGKPLFERGLLPARIRRSADRFEGESDTRSLLNPVHLGVAAFRAVDRLNDRPFAARRRTFVNALAKATRPPPR